MTRPETVATVFGEPSTGTPVVGLDVAVVAVVEFPPGFTGPRTRSVCGWSAAMVAAASAEEETIGGFVVVVPLVPDDEPGVAAVPAEPIPGDVEG